jgi:hypothetical protein
MFVLALVPNCFYGQQEVAIEPFAVLRKDEIKQGKVEIKQSVDVEELINSYIASNKKKPGMDGYRVQIYSETGSKARQEAEDARKKLLAAFPNEKVTVSYDAPYLRVRVGYYRHKHETIPLLRKIRSMFPNAYTVKESGIRPENF